MTTTNGKSKASESKEKMFDIKKHLNFLRKNRERNIPKKPIAMKVKWQYKCPSCGYRVTSLCSTEEEVLKSRETFCKRCKQKIDWSI